MMEEVMVKQEEKEIGGDDECCGRGNGTGTSEIVQLENPIMTDVAAECSSTLNGHDDILTWCRCW